MTFPKPINAKGAPVPEETVNRLWDRSGARCEAIFDNGNRCDVRFVSCASIKFKRYRTHHIKFRSRFGSNDLINLVMLCTGCHEAVHKGKEGWAKRYRTHKWQFEGRTEADAEL